MKSSEQHLVMTKQMKARKRMALEYKNLLHALEDIRNLAHGYSDQFNANEWNKLQSADNTITQAREFYFGPND